MAEKNELKYWLKRVPFFADLSPEETSELASCLLFQEYDENHPIFSYDDEGDAMYIVKEGKVDLYIRDYTGEKIILRTAESGDYFGELSLFDETTRTATAVTLGQTECYVLLREDLLRFLHKKPNVSIHLLAALSQQIRQTNTLLSGRVSRNVNAQIEEELPMSLRFANWISVFSGSMPFLIINAAWFICWILINLNLVPGVQPFDPYPFGFLTLSVSLEAIFLSIFVLLSQNLQAAKEKISRDIEYEVNLKAELEIAYLHEKIDRFHEENLKLLHLYTHGKTE